MSCLQSRSTIKVLHLTPQLSRLGGGASAYLWELVKHTTPYGIESHVTGLGDEFTAGDIAGHNAASVYAAQPSGSPAQGISRDLRNFLRHHAPQVDLIHSHGLRNAIGLQALRHARRTGLPLLVTPHGMLYPQLLQRARLKKWIVERLWDFRYRAAARCIHVTSADEAQIVRRHHPTKPIAIVPIGLDIDQFRSERGDSLEQQYPELAGKRRVLFLGIMDRKKGLLRLVEAWRRIHAQFPDWRVLIAGPDIAGHEAEVRAAVEAANLERTVFYLGGVYAADKARLYAESDVFVLPTEWENFGIVVAEALASGVPVITTRGTPWSLIETHQCGWWIENTIEALATAMQHAMSLSDSDRAAMGSRGRELIQSQFSWRQIAEQMRRLYEWIIHNGDAPDFVRE